MEYIKLIIDLITGTNSRFVGGAIFLATLLWILRQLSKPFNKWVEDQLAIYLTPENVVSVWPRLLVMFLLVHSIAAASAAVWSFFATGLPPPGVPKPIPVANPYLPQAERAVFYALPAFAASLILFLVSYPALDNPRPRLSANAERLRLSLISALAWGTIAGWALVAYQVANDPRQLSYVQLPPVGSELFLWCLAYVPMVSFGMAIVLWLPLVALRWLWRKTQNMT